MNNAIKKLSTIMVAVLCLSATLLAHDSYYYYRGTRIPLVKSTNKIVSIAPKSDNVSLNSLEGFTLVNTISDMYGNVQVYELASSATIEQAIKEISSSVCIQRCYLSSNGVDLIPNGYINVKLKSKSDFSKLRAAAFSNGCEIMEQDQFMPLWYTLRIKESGGNNSVEAANSIYETGMFAYAFPSFSCNGYEFSYDDRIDEQWGLYNSKYEGIDISISQAWNYATGRGIVIAVVDDGIDMEHEDLASNIYYKSYDTEQFQSPSVPYGDHGTHCAGIAAAVRNNGIGIAGVAPDAKLMSISNKLAYSTNYERKMANGINWAWVNGADVISCSWACEPNEFVEEAIYYAVFRGREGKGCVFVNSAGNCIRPRGSLTYPAKLCEDVLAVANITNDGLLSVTSCVGANLFVSAPGSYILSTIRGNRYKFDSGTSMACPHVAGLAALILERNPSLTAREVREIIARNTKKVGDIPYEYIAIKKYGTWNPCYGYGLIDAYKAVLNTPRNQK